MYHKIKVIALATLIFAIMPLKAEVTIIAPKTTTNLELNIENNEMGTQTQTLFAEPISKIPFKDNTITPVQKVAYTVLAAAIVVDTIIHFGNIYDDYDDSKQIKRDQYEKEWSPFMRSKQQEWIQQDCGRKGKSINCPY